MRGKMMIIDENNENNFKIVKNLNQKFQEKAKNASDKMQDLFCVLELSQRLNMEFTSSIIINNPKECKGISKLVYDNYLFKCEKKLNNVWDIIFIPILQNQKVLINNQISINEIPLLFKMNLIKYIPNIIEDFKNIVEIYSE